MSNTWDHTTFTSTQDTLDKLTELQGRSWLCRGQPRPYECGLAPSIDRDQLKNISRAEKLQRERQSIDIFRSAARFFASSGEENASNDDVIALMVLRHYSTPTRLLDWTI